MDASGSDILIVILLKLPLIPFIWIKMGGAWALAGVALVATDIFIAWKVGGSMLRWQRRMGVPEIAIGVAAILTVIICCTAIHALALFTYVHGRRLFR